MSLTPAVAEALRHALATVVVVPVTPLHAGGNPDWDTYAALTGRLIDGGIAVITPNGNTGEFYALSHAEARRAVETAAEASRGHVDFRAGSGQHLPRQLPEVSVIGRRAALCLWAGWSDGGETLFNPCSISVLKASIEPGLRKSSAASRRGQELQARMHASERGDAAAFGWDDFNGQLGIGKRIRFHLVHAHSVKPRQHM